MIIQFLLNGLITGCIYGLASTGFALVYNTTRIFHICYAGLYLLAGYLFYSLSGPDQYLNVVWGLMIASLLGVLSFLIDYFGYFPFLKKRASINVLLIVSLGFNIVIINTIAAFYGNESKIISHQLSYAINISGVYLTLAQLIQILTASILLLLTVTFLSHSMLGLKARALRDNPALLATIGVDVRILRAKLFFISGILITAAAIVNSIDIGISPYIGIPFFLNLIVAMIIGGIGKFYTPIIGGITLGIVQAVSVYFFESRWEITVTFIVLTIFLIFRPEGLFGEKQRTV